MFGERSQKDVPSLIACAGWLAGQQLRAVLNRFPAVFLEELSDESPSIRSTFGSKQLGQIGERHRPILPTAAGLTHDHLSRLPTVLTADG